MRVLYGETTSKLCYKISAFYNFVENFIIGMFLKVILPEILKNSHLTGVASL